MHTLTIKLDSIDKVKEFVRIITAFDNDFDLRSGRYTVDAKSILGIFSLDLSKPIELDVYGKDNLDEVIEALKPFEA
ncbi:MAG: HPr family phosphocarrier protein [Lachnospiraceae bacterium]|nr:HPr family phosphocarrier protein [Lachnospiraceae bacterium]